VAGNSFAAAQKAGHAEVTTLSPIMEREDLRWIVTEAGGLGQRDQIGREFHEIVFRLPDIDDPPAGMLSSLRVDPAS
jgi:hypothetical protein